MLRSSTVTHDYEYYSKPDILTAFEYFEFNELHSVDNDDKSLFNSSY